MSIDHAYGTTTIESRPERIVTIGWSSADAFLALGVIPVSIPKDSYAGDADGLLPWTHAALGDNPLPAVIDESGGIPFEAIIELQPDLIFGRYSGITEDEYNQLTEAVDAAFHPYWGSLLKELNGMSLFGQQVDLYADIYMRRVSCLGGYSPEQYFRSPHDLMPHEL